MRQTSIYNPLTSTSLSKPKRKKACYPANKPVYSNKQMKEVNNKVWDKIFPHRCMLKTSSWNQTRENTAIRWLRDNVSEDAYRVFPNDSRLVWFKHEQDRNLFLLIHNKHFIQYTDDIKVQKLMLNKI